MSSVAAARVPPRSADPEAITRTLRYIAMAREGARFMAPDRARELAANIVPIDDDLMTVEAIAESIDRRRRDLGLELSDLDAAACAKAIFAAWRDALS